VGWLEIVVLCALAWAVAALAFLYVFTDLGWDQLRNVLLQYAYKSFTHDGIAIPGMRPHLLAQLLIRILSPSDDERKQLLGHVLATEERDQPRRETVPLVLEDPSSPA
jgi:hypothetical protein